MRPTVLAALVLFAACSRGGPDPDVPGPQAVCTREARSALAVTLADASTGERVRGATVRVTTGDYTADLDEFDGVYSGAHEHAGTYTIIVSHADYQQWQRAGVVVGEDGCHVITEHIEARLSRRSP